MKRTPASISSTSPWAGSSERRATRWIGGALLALLIGGAPPASGRTAGAGAGGKVYLTVDEALALAFPECSIERKVVYLSKEQLELARKLAGVEIESGVVRPYLASRDGKPAGTAYFDTHRVRTLSETLMVVVDAQHKIRRVEVLRFDEPEEYLPKAGWFAQFQGRGLDEELRLKKGLRGVTGATLSARAASAAARRVLALHQVLNPDHP